MKPHSISVVIPNYNGSGLLESNLPSVYAALKKTNADYEVIVADDASTDGSVNFLKKNFPEIKIIESKINKGFSPTINAGIFAATKDLVLALNSDVKLTEDYFIPQLKYFTKEDTFGVMGRIIGMSDNKVQDAAKYPETKGMKLKTTRNYLIKDCPADFWTPTLFLSGANALMDRRKLFELKGFDEIYAPFYVEDVDLSLRAWRLGWKSYYEHQSICRHPASVTIENYHKKTEIKTTSLRNRFIFHAIHLDKKDFFLWKIQVLITLLFSWFPLERSNFRAYREYLKKQDEIKVSKNNLEMLFVKFGYRSDVSEVARKIKSQLTQFKIIKF
jgi:GT2 family glycosyltransferase